MSTENLEAIIKINDRLTVWDDGEDARDSARSIIAETLQKIPKLDRDKVLKDVIFIIMSGACGAHLMGLVEDKREYQLIKSPDGQGWVEDAQVLVEIKVPLILLNFALMEKEGVDEEKMRTTVAHKIAHFILRHHIIIKPRAHAEKEADDLIVKWGFKRAYQNYERFNWS